MRTNLDIQHSGTLGTEGRTAMTFDENSIAHLMTVAGLICAGTGVLMLIGTKAWFNRDYAKVH